MTQTPSSLARYATVAILLHWVIALLIIGNVGVAWYSDELKGAAKIGLMQWHKTLGICVLLLSLARLAWRLMNPPPAISSDLKPWERTLAHVVQWGFYVLMIGLPLTGWIIVSASPFIKIYPISMFGLFDWPALSFLTDLPKPQMKQVHDVFAEVHHLMAKVIVYGLIPLHVIGALKHQFMDKDDTLARMIPFLRRAGQ